MSRKPTAKGTRRRARLRIESLLDDIKDAIDRLHEIKNKKQRVEATQDLVEYLELHHLSS